MTNDSAPTTSKRDTLLAIGVILLVVMGLFAIWQSNTDPRTDELNRMIADDLEISEYDYPFRVFGVEGNTAVVSTPRSPQMSVLRALEIIRPQLDVDQPDTPEVIAAQKELAGIQYRVRDLLLSHPQIDDVRWQLDKQWYLQHGVMVQ